jgi:hypothetical protein
MNKGFVLHVWEGMVREGKYSTVKGHGNKLVSSCSNSKLSSFPFKLHRNFIGIITKAHNNSISNLIQQRFILTILMNRSIPTFDVVKERKLEASYGGSMTH